MIDFAGHAKSSSSRVRLTLSLMCLAGCTFIFGQDVNQAPSAAKPKSAGAGQVQRIYRQGMAALERRDLAAARAAFEKVVRLAPKSPEGHNSLGWVLLAQGEAQPAISQFRTALQFKPDVALKTSYLNDVRFDEKRGNGGTGFITDSSDSGPNGVIVVDLETGNAFRRLSDHPSTRADQNF